MAAKQEERAIFRYSHCSAPNNQNCFSIVDNNVINDVKNLGCFHK